MHAGHGTASEPSLPSDDRGVHYATALDSSRQLSAQCNPGHRPCGASASLSPWHPPPASRLLLLLYLLLLLLLLLLRLLLLL